MNDSPIQAFIKKIPLFDLHFHFEGAIPWQTIRLLHPQGNSLPKNPPWYGDPVRFSRFESFLEVFNDYIRPCLGSVDQYLTCAASILQWLEDSQINYVEWNISIKPILMNGLAIEDVFREIDHFLRVSKKQDGPIIRLIAGINREFPLPEKISILSRLKTIHGIMGIDIHGFEQSRDLYNHESFFMEAHHCFKKVKVHAGELGDAGNVRFAVEKLGVKHICHGIQSVHDDPTLDVLAYHDTILELSSSSNLSLGIVPDNEEYPFRKLLEKKVRFAVNTDDPVIFNCALIDEYHRFSQSGLAPHELLQLVLTAIEASTLTPYQKEYFQLRTMELFTQA